MFSTFPKTNFSFLAKFDLSSANAFNSEQSRNLLFGKEFKHTTQPKWEYLKTELIFLSQRKTSNLETVTKIVIEEKILITNIFPFSHNVFKDFLPTQFSTLLLKCVVDIIFPKYGTTNYSITCIQRPLKGSNESGLLLQVVFKCRRVVVA